MKDRGQKTGTQFLAGLAIGLCYVWLIVDARAASAASVSALGLCAKVIVPSLFPFFVCSNLFCALGLERPMERVLSRVVEPLFGVPGSGAAALFVGLTGGYPSGAQSVGALYGGGSIDRQTAKRLLLFCNNCGPAFIFGVVGPSVFGSSLAGLLLYLVHVASSLLLGIFVRKSGHLVGSILGAGLMFVLTFLGADLAASCWNLFLYTALWLLPGLLAGLLAGRA